MRIPFLYVPARSIMSPTYVMSNGTLLWQRRQWGGTTPEVGQLQCGNLGLEGFSASVPE